MNIRDSINQFYYDMTVSDLRRLHRGGSTELSYNTVMYLDMISYQSEREGGCTVSGLARTLGISKPAVTMKVNELVGLGLVVREQSPGDKRVYHLRVSPQVEKSLADCDRPLERAIQRAHEEFTPRQIQDFCQILAVFSHEFSAEEFINAGH